eukprot:scaffold10283_cov31-Tisochrysis_lutea.AAC.3
MLNSIRPTLCQSKLPHKSAARFHSKAVVSSHFAFASTPSPEAVLSQTAWDPIQSLPRAHSTSAVSAAESVCPRARRIRSA